MSLVSKKNTEKPRYVAVDATSFPEGVPDGVLLECNTTRTRQLLSRLPTLGVIKMMDTIAAMNVDGEDHVEAKRYCIV